MGFVPDDFLIIPGTNLSSFSNFDNLDFNFTTDDPFQDSLTGYLLTPDPSTAPSDDLFTRLIESHAYMPTESLGGRSSQPALSSQQQAEQKAVLVAMTDKPKRLLKLVPGAG